MYLTVHLVLFAGAFVLFAWQLCTWRSRAAKHRPYRRQHASSLSTARVSRGVNLRDFHQPSERPKKDASASRRRLGSSLGDEYRPVNRIHHYLS